MNRPAAQKMYKQCTLQMKEIAALTGALRLLSWDRETMMPLQAAPARAEQSAALAGIIHDKQTNRKLGGMLRKLKAEAEKLSPDQQAIVREWLRDYQKEVKMPPLLVRELAKVRSLSQGVWVEARQSSRFSHFAPWLEKILKLTRRKAEAVGYDHQAYDALLDDFEPKMTVALLNPIVADVRRGLVPLVAAIRESGVKIDRQCLTRTYSEIDQETLCRHVMLAMGVDPQRSRLDRSVHPFCGGTGPTDVRLTTRYNVHWLPGSLYGTIHESGHALYELGFEERYYDTPLADAASLGIHESQSRMWENVIGRSRPFVRYLLPRLKERFRGQLRGVHEEAFFRAINRVEPSPIRVEADEVTYNLHIVLRYEIEKALLEGEIRVNELPALWNAKMKSYLGITPKNDAQGVLQDVHWSMGAIGYFPTYMLGNLYAAQLWETLAGKIHGVETKIARGHFSPILLWLRTNIHRHGRRYSPTELVKRATGKPPSAHYFLDYLRKKYGALYGISWNE